MKIALVFPGQGSQFIGMGHDFADKFDVSKQVFTDLDAILGRNLSKIIFNGPIEDLTLTINSQPSIMAVSVAILNAIKKNNLLNLNKVSAVAGHSLGEYSALVANDSLSFNSAVELLKVRSEAMQDSMPIVTGGMAAVIGKSIDDMDQILPKLKELGFISIANDNADGQVVLSGEIKPINYLCQNSKEFGIKRALKLPVSAPFHCDLIKSASEKLSKVIENYNFNNFQYDFYSNVTSTKISNIEIQEFLIRQVISKVRWREIILNMISDEIDCFIEIGPGNILSNLIKRINKDAVVINISKIEDLDKLKMIG